MNMPKPGQKIWLVHTQSIYYNDREAVAATVVDVHQNNFIVKKGSHLFVLSEDHIWYPRSTFWSRLFKC